MIKKIILIIALCLFLSSNVFALPEPKKRPSNIPKEAYWENDLWRYFDENKSIFYNWYGNGKLKSKGSIKNNKPFGEWFYYSPDGIKLMRAVIKNDKIVEKYNYKILIPDLQRPLNIPKKAKWDFKEKAWAYRDTDNIMLYAWYMNGEKMMKAKYSNNKPDGLYNGIFIWWHQHGVKSLEGNYKNGIKHGKFIHRNKKGDLTNIRYYRNGRKIWSNSYEIKPPKNLPEDAVWHIQFKGWRIIKDNIQYVYDDAGKLQDKTEMKGLDYHGKTTSYFKTGEVMLIGQFIESSMEGKWKYYYRNGKVGRIEYYKNNKEIKSESFKKK